MVKIVIETRMKAIPKRCQNCHYYGYQNNYGWAGNPCCTAMQDKEVKPKERPEWCPLVEVPPHGRLIDADALIATEKEQFKLFKTVNLRYDIEQRDALVRSITNIINAPTIILAETDSN